MAGLQSPTQDPSNEISSKDFLVNRINCVSSIDGPTKVPLLSLVIVNSKLSTLADFKSSDILKFL